MSVWRKHADTALENHAKRVRRRRVTAGFLSVALVATLIAFAIPAFTLSSNQAAEIGITSPAVQGTATSSIVAVDLGPDSIAERATDPDAESEETLADSEDSENPEGTETDGSAEGEEGITEETPSALDKIGALSDTLSAESLEPEASAGRDDNLEFAFVQGTAALSRDIAADTLLEAQGDWPGTEEEAHDVADRLFGDGLLSFSPTIVQSKPAKRTGRSLSVQSLDTTPVSTLSRSGDGSHIERIEVKWATQDSEGAPEPAASDDTLLYVKPANDFDADQYVIAQVNYSLSGEYNYEPGTIRITVPAHIFKNRIGKWEDVIVIPMPEAPGTNGDFNWVLTQDASGQDCYVLTNTRKMSAASKGFVQFGITQVTPHEVIDMKKSEPFSAMIELTTHRGNQLGLASNQITAQIDTSQRVTEAQKRSNSGARIVDRADIVDRLPSGAPNSSQYVVIDWYVRALHNGNQEFVLSATDTVGRINGAKGFVVDATQVAADGKTSKVTPSVSAESVKMNNLIPSGWQKDGWTSIYYVTTAYPFNESTFAQNVYHKLCNDITFTLTEKDSGAVTTASASAYCFFEWHKPKFVEPNGHFNVFKWGNDGEEADYLDHAFADNGVGFKDSPFNKEIFYNGKHPFDHVGLYYEALNDLSGKNGTEPKDVEIAYTIETDAYHFPWTYVDDGTANSARKLSNYGKKKVLMTTTEAGLKFGEEPLTPGTDYTFKQIEIPRPGVGYAKAVNLDANGDFVYSTGKNASDGKFDYIRHKDYSVIADEPLVLDIEVNGAWINDYAKVYWDEAEPKVHIKGQSPVQNADAYKIQLPDNTTNFRVHVASKQAYYHYNLLPTVVLKANGKAGQLAAEAFGSESGRIYSPMATVSNGARLDVTYDQSGGSIVSIPDAKTEYKWGVDRLYGYTDDSMAIPSKDGYYIPATQEDLLNRVLHLHYSAKMQFQSFIPTQELYDRGIEKGTIPHVERGTWFDLLPPGVTPVLDSVKLRDGDSLETVYAIDNYKGSGRMLLVAKADLAPQPQTYTLENSDVELYEDVPTIEFDADYSLDAYYAYGDTIHNVVAFEAFDQEGKELPFVGSLDGFKGELDNAAPATPGNSITRSATVNNLERRLMTGLDAQRDAQSTAENFLFAGHTMQAAVPSAARVGLNKDLSTNGDGYWSTGTAEGDDRYVYEDGFYTYRLQVTTAQDTVTRGIVLYDTLESFLPGMYDDKCPHKGDKQWRGELVSVNVDQLREKGCEPVVYYSTLKAKDTADSHIKGIDFVADKVGPSLSNENNYEAVETRYRLDGNPNVWTRADSYTGDMADVTMVAIDARKKADGTDFELGELETILVLLNMHAPAETDDKTDDDARDYIAANAHAYNNVFLESLAIDKETGIENSTWAHVRKDYTRVGLREYEVAVTKDWDDDDNRDGVRTDEVTLHLLRTDVETGETVDTGKSIKLRKDGYVVVGGESDALVTTRKNYDAYDEATGQWGVDEDLPDWTGYFTRIPSTNPNGVPYAYSVTEDPVNFTLDGEEGSYRVSVGSQAEGAFSVRNIHEPVRISIAGSKTWVGDAEEAQGETADSAAGTTAQAEAPSVRPSSITVQLYKNGTRFREKVVRSDSNGDWNYSFDNLHKYENGEKITYTILEKINRDDYVSYRYRDEKDLLWAENLTPQEAARKILDGSVQHVEEGAYNLVNFYNPHGDVVLSKKLSNATPKASEQPFAFEFLLTEKVENKVLDAEGNETGETETIDQPNTETFDYAVFSKGADELKDEPVSRGTITSGGTISIKGGQYARIYDLPANSTYTFTEKEQSGFTAATDEISGTVKANYVIEEKFSTGRNVAAFDNYYKTSGRASVAVNKKLHGKMTLRDYQFRFDMNQLGPGLDGELGTDDDLDKRTVRTTYNRITQGVADDDLNTTGPVQFGSISYSNDSKTGVEVDESNGWCYQDAEDPNTWHYTYEITERVPDGAAAYDEQGRAVTSSGDEPLLYADANEQQRATYTWKLDGYTYDSAALRVHMTVTDNGNGTMSAVPTYLVKNGEGNWVEVAEGDLDAARTFENDYEAEGSFQIRAWKQLDGRTLKEGEFSFELLNLDGSAVYANGDGKLCAAGADGASRVVAANNAAGTIDFGPFNLDLEQLIRAGKESSGVPKVTYDEDARAWIAYFVARERIPSRGEAGFDASVVYDKSAFGYRVTITDNGDGTLSVAQNFVELEALEEGTGWRVAQEGAAAGGTETGETAATMQDKPASSLPVFKNGLQPGGLEVAKRTQWDASTAPDPDQRFHFRVKLTGEHVADITSLNYTVSNIENASESQGEGAADTAANANATSPASAADGAQPAANAEAAEGTGVGGGSTGQANDGLQTQSEPPASQEPIWPSSTSTLVDTLYWTATGATVTKADDDSNTVSRDASNPVAMDIYDDGTLVFRPSNPSQATTSLGCFGFSKRYNKLVEAYPDTVSFLEETGIRIYFEPGLSLANAFACGNTRGSSASELIVSVDMSNLDASELTKLASAFAHCYILESVKLPRNAPKLDSLAHAFAECEKLTSVDLSVLGKTQVTYLQYAFGFEPELRHSSNLTEVNMTGFETATVTSMYRAFCRCGKLKELDLSGVTTASNVNMTQAFNASAINRLTLGDGNFYFNGTESWRSVPGNESDYWVLSGTENTDEPTLMKGSELATATPAPAGTWISPYEAYTLNLSQGATGSGSKTVKRNATAAAVVPSVDDSWRTPSNDFVGWKLENSAVEAINDAYGATMVGSEGIVQPGFVIPAETFSADAQVSLTAQWEPFNRTATLADGAFDFYLKGGQKAVFANPDGTFQLPAGTAYQVWEETPSGWQLVEQTDGTGAIKTTEIAAETFVNEYAPGLVTAQFTGTKTLDGQIVGAGAFSFALRPASTTAAGLDAATMPMPETPAGSAAGTGLSGEGAERTYTATTSAGGFVQYPSIAYTVPGTYTYTLAEIVPDSPAKGIVYDSRTWTATVVVVDNGAGTLTAKTSYSVAGGEPASSFAFENERVSGSLRIAKVADAGSLTDANKDDKFTFKVRFFSDAGLPYEGEGGFSYYKIDEHGNVVTPEEDEAEYEPTRPVAPEGLAWSAWTTDGSNLMYSLDEVDGTLWLKAPEGEDAGTWNTLAGLSGIDSSLRSQAKRIRVDNASTVTMVGARDNTSGGSTALSGCTNLEEFYGSGFVANTAGLSNFFRGLSSLRVIEVGDWDVSGVSDLSRMFQGTGIESIDLSGWNTASATDLNRMFYGCSSLVSANLAGMDVSKVKNADSFFNSCKNLESADLSGWNTASLSSLSAFFSTSTAKLREVTIGNDFKLPNVGGLNAGKTGSGDTQGWRRLEDGAYSANTFVSAGNKAGTWVWSTNYIGGLAAQSASANGASASEAAAGGAAASSVINSVMGAMSALSLGTQDAGDGSDEGPATIVAQGTCGAASDPATWTLDSNGLLTFGAGNIGDTMARTLKDANGNELRNNIVRVKFEPGCKATSLYGMFGQYSIACANLKSVDFTNLDTTELGSVAHLFDNCKKLENVTFPADFDTSRATSFGNMFRDCRELRTLDLSMLDTRNVSSMYEMFFGCSGLTQLNVSNFDTTKVKSMFRAFSGCNKLTVLDLTSFDTHNVTDFKEIFKDCTALETLIIPGFDISQFIKVAGGGFTYDVPSQAFKSKDSSNGCPNLSTVVFGPGMYNNADEQLNQYFQLPTPPSDSTTGCWRSAANPAKTATPEELLNLGDSGIADTWVWELATNRERVVLDANGGTITGTAQFELVGTVQGDDVAFDDFALPNRTATQAARPGYHLNGWSTEPSGGGEFYPVGTAYKPVGGRTVVLYAQWVEEGQESRLVVKHQRQNPTTGDLRGIVETTEQVVTAGYSYMPEVRSYENYVAPAAQTVTVPAAGTRTITYQYRALPYTVAYDANGGRGEVRSQEVGAGKPFTVATNKFKLGGHAFVGWNTKADGTGASYTPGQAVGLRNSLAAPGQTITLYAQWLSNSFKPLKPVDGVVTLKLKAGETAVFDNLPPGVSYEVVETDLPGGWSFDSATGENVSGKTVTGEAQAADTDAAQFTNAYDAEGTAAVLVHKRLVGAELAEGQFEFALYRVKADGTLVKGGPITTATNGAVDTNENVLVEESDDEFAMQPNPHVGTAPVYLEIPGEFSLAKIAEDVEAGLAVPMVVDDTGNATAWSANSGLTANAWRYSYVVREVVPENRDYVEYDERDLKANVLVRDAGNGQLTCTVEYVDGDTFVNQMEKGALQFSKIVDNATPVIVNKTFDFRVTLKDADGNELSGSFDVVLLDGNDDEAAEHTYERGGEGFRLSSGGTITLAGGETARVKGLPAGTKYEIAEVNADAGGFTLVEHGGEAGDILPGRTSSATFTNRYDAAGEVTLTARKSLATYDKNGVEAESTVPTDKYFSFTLSDESLAPLQTVQNEDGGLVSFDTFGYTLADLEGGTFDSESGAYSKTFTYYITESGSIFQKNVTDGTSATGRIDVDAEEMHKMTFDTTPRRVEVTVTDTGTGTLSVTKTAYDAAGVAMEGDPVFNNEYREPPDAYELPESGGPGTLPFTVAGFVMAVVAGVSIVVRRTSANVHYIDPLM